MTATALTSRQRHPHAPLSRERVLQAALAFVDAHGLSALSMHKLGAELGVRGMSLYSHVDSKDTLLDGMVTVMWEELELPPTSSKDWRKALTSYAHALRGLIRRHPHAAPLLISRPIMSTYHLEVLDAHLQVLRGGRFTDERAVELLRTVEAYALGYALLEVSYLTPQPARDEDDLERFRRVAAMAPADTPDHLLRLAIQYCGGCDMNDQFNLGVDLMLRGVEPEASRDRPTTRHATPDPL